jgi:hypothetical protein
MLDNIRWKALSNPFSSRKQNLLLFGDNKTTNIVSSVSVSANVESEISVKTNTVFTGNSKGCIQRLIHDGPNPTPDTKLTMAIANMIHGCCLAYSLVLDHKLWEVIQLV